jgi:ABC-type sugar transport system ATPase subunit
MRREIVRIQKQLGVTTVHVTHDQAEALTMGDRIALLNEGQMVQVGSPQELYRNPANLFVANFLGHPKINVVAARMHDGMLLPFGLPVPKVLLNGKTENVLMGVRPESIEISSSGDFASKVISSEYMGDGYVIELDYKDNRLTVSQCATPFGEGEPVKFSVDRKSLLYFDATSKARLSTK